MRVYTAVNECTKGKWVVDSGATSHVTSFRKDFLEGDEAKVMFADGSQLSLTAKDSLYYLEAEHREEKEQATTAQERVNDNNHSNSVFQAEPTEAVQLMKGEFKENPRRILEGFHELMGHRGGTCPTGEKYALILRDVASGLVAAEGMASKAEVPATLRRILLALPKKMDIGKRVTMARSMLFDAKLPVDFWLLAIQHAATVTNYLGAFQSMGLHPPVDDLRRFGVTCCVPWHQSQTAQTSGLTRQQHQC